MPPEQITNANVMSTDFARHERISFLRSLPNMKKHGPMLLATGLSARGIWINDVSSMDRRSVKAHLAAHGDYRVLWWQINCVVHRIMKPRATLEQQMFAFHQRQHRLTIGWFNFIQNIRAVALSIERGEIRRALRLAAKDGQPQQHI